MKIIFAFILFTFFGCQDNRGSLSREEEQESEGPEAQRQTQEREYGATTKERLKKQHAE